jgi:tetratricopeptide (TPR) repeat protein
MSTSDSRHELIAEIERCEGELDRRQRRVEEYGEDDLGELTEAYEQFSKVLGIYQDQVTGDDGDIQTIVKFQGEIDRVMTDIPDDVLHADIFEECDEYLQQKWFSDSDFEHVYDQLDPLADLAEWIGDRDEALEAYRKARRDIEARLRECERELDDLDRLADLSEADLDAPTERLEEPIQQYNDAVTETFREFKRSASAREVVRFLDKMERYPLVAFESPPRDVVEYIAETPTGTEPIVTILEYTDYSRSKLEHYVEEPSKLKHAIEGHRAYLDALDGGPLTISWPPPTAEQLEYRCRELTAAVNRIDPDVVEQLRTVQALPRETDYGRLRRSAVVRQDLSDEERERLQSGQIEADIAELRAEREQLQEALEAYPDR